MMGKDELYTPEEVAEKLKISKYTVYEMVKRGDIQAHRIGRAIRISDDQINIYFLNSTGEGNLFEAEILEAHQEKFILINGIKVGIVTDLQGFVKIAIRPDDIILSKDIIQSSARNMLRGKVTDIQIDGNYAKIKLDAGIPLRVIITQKSAEEMNTRVSQDLYAIFKATSVKVYK